MTLPWKRSVPSSLRKNERGPSVEMGVHPAIVEKDFWVCWVLDYLFESSLWKDHLSFKGGTSLSKAFGAIERFSEDIDLVLDWPMLGYGSTEPLEQRSATQQDCFGKLANQRAGDFLRQTVAATLPPELSERPAKAVHVCGYCPSRIIAKRFWMTTFKRAPCSSDRSPVSR
jgi:hypothetical protein